MLYSYGIDKFEASFMSAVKISFHQITASLVSVKPHTIPVTRIPSVLKVNVISVPLPQHLWYEGMR